MSAVTPRVAFLDHTADVGFDVAAAGPEALLDAAARGMLALLRGEEDEVDADAGSGARTDAGGSPTERVLALTAPDPARLLAEWLRELLFLHETEALDYEGAEFDVLRLDPGDAADAAESGVAGAPGCRLEARVRLRTGGHAVREIKGVTYHEIEARPTAGGWAARVIFDV